MIFSPMAWKRNFQFLTFVLNMKLLIYSKGFEKNHSDKIMIFLNSQSFSINHMKRDFDVKSSIFAPN